MSWPLRSIYKNIAIISLHLTYNNARGHLKPQPYINTTKALPDESASWILFHYIHNAMLQKNLKTLHCTLLHLSKGVEPMRDDKKQKFIDDIRQKLAHRINYQTKNFTEEFVLTFCLSINGSLFTRILEFKR